MVEVLSIIFGRSDFLHGSDAHGEKRFYSERLLMNLTLLVKLQPNPAQAQARLETMERFNAACNAIAATAFREHPADMNEDLTASRSYQPGGVSIQQKGFADTLPNPQEDRDAVTPSALSLHLPEEDGGFRALL